MKELNEYQKLDWISFAIDAYNSGDVETAKRSMLSYQEAMNGNPNELDQALELVEELRDLHGEEA